jgi:hypothetical protein
VLPYRRCDQPEDRQEIVVLQGAPVVPPHPAGRQFIMKGVEQAGLESLPQLGVPVHGHHAGQVVRAHVDAPRVPVEQPAAVPGAVARQEAVPDVRISLDHCHVAVRLIARRQSRSGVEQALIQRTSIRRKALAHFVRETRELEGEILRPFRSGSCILPGADRHAEPRVVPPCGLAARPRANDGLALRKGRRQGPAGRHRMRIREILQQQVPSAGGVIPGGVVTLRHDAWGHGGREVAIERHLVTAAQPGPTRALCQPGLQDKRRGRTRCRVGEDQAQPEDVREHRRERCLHRHFGDATFPERSRPPQHIREGCSIGNTWKGWTGHAGF